MASFIPAAGFVPKDGVAKGMGARPLRVPPPPVHRPPELAPKDPKHQFVPKGIFSWMTGTTAGGGLVGFRISPPPVYPPGLAPKDGVADIQRSLEQFQAAHDFFPFVAKHTKTLPRPSAYLRFYFYEFAF